jgi:hypothetical protein
VLLLRAGLYAGALIALYATWASHQAGYHIEVALLRGLVAFMAASVVAYCAELVVATAPPLEGAAPVAADDDEYADDDEEDEAAAPVSLEAVRAQGRIGAPGDRRAA